MATKIVTKNSSTASAVPTASDLVQGELAVNVADKRLFTEDNGGSVVELGTNPSSLTVSGNIDVDGVTNLDAVDIDGAVDMASTLQVDGAATFTTEITANGGIALGDNDKATFGASDDLQIYHDGVSRIKELGAGGLYVDVTNDMYIRRGDTSVVMAEFNAGVAKLMFDGSQKLATTSTGIDVTGTATMDGLTVDGVGRIEETGGAARLTIARTDAANSAESASLDLMENNATNLSFGDVASFGYRLEVDGSTNKFNIISGNQTATKKRFSIDRDTGDISFYEDTGTTPKLFWDASQERLNIGTSSSSEVLGVYKDSVNQAATQYGNSTTGEGAGNGFVVGVEGGGNGLIWNRENSFIRFGTNAAERMRIDSSGRVGIGNSSPSGVLDVSNGTNSLNTGVNADRIQFKTAGLNYIQSEGALFLQPAGDLVFNGTGAEIMRLKSGRVGIGTSSPLADLHIEKSNAAPRLIVKRPDGSNAADSGSIDLLEGSVGGGFGLTNNYGFRIALDGADNKLNILSGNQTQVDTRLTIERDSGNVNIATGSLRVALGSDEGSQLNAWSESSGEANLAAYTLKFKTGGNNSRTERMRIDSSGNLLVGTTSQYGQGLSLNANATAYFRKAGDAPLTLRRDSTDGSILNLYKDGTTVGSIGSEGGDTLYIGTSDTGLRFHSADRIVPHNPATNTARDAAIDLGRASERFKDLYLSGGVYLGGTGAANKLDDYEEGTFTPAFAGPSAVTYIQQSGRYTKVGREVHVQAVIRWSAFTAGVSNVSLGGLPFSLGGTDNFINTLDVTYANNTNFTYINEYLSSGSMFFYNGASSHGVASTNPYGSSGTILINGTFYTS